MNLAWCRCCAGTAIALLQSHEGTWYLIRQPSIGVNLKEVALVIDDIGPLGSVAVKVHLQSTHLVDISAQCMLMGYTMLRSFDWSQDPNL